MTDSPVTSWPVRALAAAIAGRELSPVAVAEAFLARAGRTEPVVSAFAHLDPDLVRAQAERAEAELATGRPRGPLHGLPIGVKDLIDTADMPTCYGSRVYSGHRPDRDAEVVRRLRAAGAVVFGKNTTQEFAVGIACAPTANPWDAARVAGGSSGGSAAAVAAGACVASVASDTGGSIRIPAAFCGVFGLRPTSGRIPHEGVWPASPTLDRVGPIARTAADAEVLFRCLAGLPDGVDDHGAVAGLRIGVLADWFASADPEVAEPVAELVRRLVAAGAESVEVPVPAADLVGRAYQGVAIGELAEVHRENADAGLLNHNPVLLAAVAAGRSFDARMTEAARDALVSTERAWDDLFARTGVDVLVSPTTPMVACPPADLAPAEMRAGSLTIPITLSGLPAASLPAGFAAGLPVGVQLIGRRGADLHLLTTARAVEELVDRQAEPIAHHR
jgi:aspartyl-tRNA(Asn)/glutamyl-tRNA(Gln) amidotransferase subunit A